MTNNYPKLHNAAWPGVVGKGPETPEPFIDLDAMLEMTAAASVGGVKFDGIDLFICAPHVDIDSSDDNLKRLAEKLAARNLLAGSLVAPVWPPAGGGSAMGDETQRNQFVSQVRKTCRIGRKLRELGVRKYGIVRIDSAVDPDAWSKDPLNNTKLIAGTFQRACDVAEEYGERLAAEGEICWGGIHSWKEVINLLEQTDRPETLGYQADMAHTLLFMLGYNAPNDAILPDDFDWSDQERFDQAYDQMTQALRPWTVDFHIAQNDATVKGQGSHDKTGKHCLPNDPNGKLDVTRAAGSWLRDETGEVTKAFNHICWDGCMFPNNIMQKPETWNEILSAMIDVRRAHGWRQ